MSDCQTGRSGRYRLDTDNFSTPGCMIMVWMMVNRDNERERNDIHIS